MVLIRMIEIQKEIFVLELEQGVEIYIPHELR